MTVFGPISVQAQTRWAELVTPGGALEAELRVHSISAGGAESGFLIRHASGRSVPLFDGVTGLHWGLVAPDAVATWNSAQASSFNDGALRAGRGLNARLAFGAWIVAGPVTAIIAPEVLSEQNLAFQTIAFPATSDPSRSPWANPFHPLPESIDAPIRFGDAADSRIGPGQSSLAVRLGSMTVGLATENEWWGPGIRNGLLLSSQAPGFPHGFVGTDHPIETVAGAVEVRWILGRLDESDYFDSDPSNDHRSLSALALTVRPAFDRSLSLGLARVVWAPLPPGQGLAGAAFDFARSVGRPNSVPVDSVSLSGSDQITAIFGRWAFPGVGFEVYGEWARFEQPRSIGDLLEFPQHSQAYTVGLRWVNVESDGPRFRAHVELTNLEPSATFRHRSVYSSYTSRAVPQGYTHLGQVLGASTGPGSSSQWVALDRGVDDTWSAGVFAGRIRWDDGVLFTPIVPEPKREDVSLFWGARGHVVHEGWRITGELSQSVRFNYLFQATVPDIRTGDSDGVDVANTSVSVGFSKAVAR